VPTADLSTEPGQDLVICHSLQMQSGHATISAGLAEVQLSNLLAAHDIDPSNITNDR
jgi:hypothetical protein